MSFLYITEHGTEVSVSHNCVRVQSHRGSSRNIPIETLEGISILCKAQLTTQCAVECMKRGIPVSYYSAGGRYYGGLKPAEHVHVARQRKQISLYDSGFALEFGRVILQAKIKNQETLLRRYSKNQGINIAEEIKMMNIFYGKIRKSNSMKQMMGYEGGAAKYYFQGLSKVVDEPFRFRGRSRRPPRDAFNAMLSLGYSMLTNEMSGIIRNHGLHPYFGLIHRDRDNHPALASDLIEEWRSVIVDAVTMSLVNGHEIATEDFYHDMDEPGYFLTKEGLRKFIDKLEKKERTEIKYLSYVSYPVSFRKAMELQVGNLVRAMKEEDSSLYQPMRIR